MPGPVAVLPPRRVPALAAADVWVLARVDVDRAPVGVLRPGAGALAAGARRGDRLAALEGSGDVVRVTDRECVTQVHVRQLAAALRMMAMSVDSKTNRTR